MRGARESRSIHAINLKLTIVIITYPLPTQACNRRRRYFALQ